MYEAGSGEAVPVCSAARRAPKYWSILGRVGRWVYASGYMAGIPAIQLAKSVQRPLDMSYARHHNGPRPGAWKLAADGAGSLLGLPALRAVMFYDWRARMMRSVTLFRLRLSSHLNRESCHRREI